MMVVVTFVSLCVHIYTIGYMRDDPGYTRFFSYIALFTFAMLMLVMANNFLQLFFGWEGVGLVSYLLIGFWYTRASATVAGFKAFIVNRIGDFGFVLGIWADGFEKLQMIPMLVVTPLTFLGGSFYSVNMLPSGWRTVALLNPVVYLISGFRWSFYEIADVSPSAPQPITATRSPRAGSRRTSRG